MAASNNGASRGAAKKIRALEEEVKTLRGRVDGLLKVNESQLQRLAGHELVKMRVRELEKQLDRKGK